MSEFFGLLRRAFGALPDAAPSPELEAARARAMSGASEARAASEAMRQRLEAAVTRRRGEINGAFDLTSERLPR